jgi:hypothetical protein
MPITDAQADDFGKYARNPETWVLAARRSLAVARLLMNRSAELRLSTNRDFFEFSGCYYAGYFHAGIALENAAKAVLISRDPTIVSKGALDVKKFGSRSGHALLEPAQSILASLTKDERCFVTKLEEFVWAGRYTVPTKADVLYDEERMNNVRLSTPDEFNILRSLVDRIISKVAK